MSNKYKHGDHLPNSVLANRLDELAEAVTKGRKEINREFIMRVPAELGRDPDLVMSQAAIRLRELEFYDFISRQGKKVMALSFTENEMLFLAKGAKDQGISESTFIRKALNFYQQDLQPDLKFPIKETLI